MRIVVISDTHCRISKVKIPDGDLLIHAGDLTFRGNIEEVTQEARQLNKLKSKFTHGILAIPGNHDWGFQHNPDLFKQIMGDIKVLIHESIIIENINFFGSPFTPEFCNWAFNVPRGEALKKLWADIPDNTQILITHGPPYGILDKCPDGRLVGCQDLYQRIQNLPNLTHHIFGHIHDAYGQQQRNNVTYINASICTEAYKPDNKPIIIEV